MKIKNLEELFNDKDFVLSTNLENSIYSFMEMVGVSKNDILFKKYEGRVSEFKEQIYKLFSSRLNFKYEWDSYYHIADAREKIKND